MACVLMIILCIVIINCRASDTDAFHKTVPVVLQSEGCNQERGTNVALNSVDITNIVAA